ANTASQQAGTAAQQAANEAQRLKQAESDRIAKQQGNERLKQLEGEVPLSSQIIRDYATPAGLAGGTLVGAGLRTIATKGMNAFNRANVAKAEALFAGDATGIPGRTARLNEFWRLGGAGAGEVPYINTPMRNPGRAANEGASALETL